MQDLLDGPEVSMGILLELDRMIHMEKNVVFSCSVSLSMQNRSSLTLASKSI